MHGFYFKEISGKFRPWQRSFQFWVRATNIYTGYKVCQFRVSLEKDAKKQEQMWESQQKQATDKIYFVCSDLGGFVTLISDNRSCSPARGRKRGEYQEIHSVRYGMLNRKPLAQYIALRLWWHNSCGRLLIFPTPVVARYDALDQQGRNEWIEGSHNKCGRLLIFPTQCPRI
ncbi:hypothetical protein F2Q70_00004220 [Brassica cretica]|uniref:Uncharacterized protein n=1 Tax=Brassica cretica TaxID=69181 RepID=A0A8S9J3Z7_BRACR|nr:hypothetical protein F2Q70_00004220 [Brassica cretica]